MFLSSNSSVSTTRGNFQTQDKLLTLALIMVGRGSRIPCIFLSAGTTKRLQVTTADTGLPVGQRMVVKERKNGGESLFIYSLKTISYFYNNHTLKILKSFPCCVQETAHLCLGWHVASKTPQSYTLWLMVSWNSALITAALCSSGCTICFCSPATFLITSRFIWGGASAHYAEV